MIPETIDLREWHLRELMRLMLAPQQVTPALAEYLESNEYGLALDELAALVNRHD